MKYLKVEGAGRLRLRGGAVGLGSTSRWLARKESPIWSVLFRSPIRLAMTDVARVWGEGDELCFSISDFSFGTICGLGLLPSVFRLGFGFFFFWRNHGPWVCYHLLGLPYVVFFFRLGLLSHLLFRIDVRIWAVGLLCYFFFFAWK